MTLSEWVVCTAYDCQAADSVTVDLVVSGNDLFISFCCTECDANSLEDDLRWWVRCPRCDADKVEHPIDHVEGNALDSGEIKFTCTQCGLEQHGYPSTRWDNAARS